jgi:hypothetical protein
VLRKGKSRASPRSIFARASRASALEEASHAYHGVTVDRRHAVRTADRGSFANSTPVDKAPAAAPSTGAKAAKAAPKRDLGKEAMGETASSRSTMTPEQQKMRAAEKAEKQAQRAKKKTEDAQKKADEAKRQADAAQQKADAAKK